MHAACRFDGVPPSAAFIDTVNRVKAKTNEVLAPARAVGRNWQKSGCCVSSTCQVLSKFDGLVNALLTALDNRRVRAPLESDAVLRILNISAPGLEQKGTVG